MLRSSPEGPLDRRSPRVLVPALLLPECTGSRLSGGNYVRGSQGMGVVSNNLL